MTPPINKVTSTTNKVIELPKPKGTVKEIKLGRLNGQEVVLFDENGNGVYDGTDSVEVIYKKYSNETQSRLFKINHLKSSLKKWGVNAKNWKSYNEPSDKFTPNFKSLNLKHFGIFKGNSVKNIKESFNNLKTFGHFLLKGMPVRIGIFSKKRVHSNKIGNSELDIKTENDKKLIIARQKNRRIKISVGKSGEID